MKHFISTTLLILALLLPATANAYDFEVDGIYYNRTSSNTVEVTYKIISDNYDNDKYSGTIVIPNHVTYNSVNYNVTSIGDSAFYYCNIQEVTIPESVTSIGVAAFKNIKGALKVTCLASTPPTMEGAFDKHEHRFPFTLFFSGYLEQQYSPYLALFVSTAAYQYYKTENETFGYFSWIFCYDGEKTADPSYTIDYENSFGRITAIHVSFSSNEESVIYNYRDYSWVENYVHYWSEGSQVSIYSQSTCQKTTVYGISGFAIAEGKLPSNLVSASYDFIYLRAPYTIYDSYADDSFFDSGIYYIVRGGSASVSAGLHKDPCGYSPDWIRGVNYSGNIIIPESVNGYPVQGIGYNAFADCDLESLELPNTINNINYTAFDGARIKKLYYTISNSNNQFYGCSADTVQLKGNGDWHGLFPDNVKVLYIGSGVTGIEDMFYNEHTPVIELNPEVIYSYATTPPLCNEFSFTGYDAELHVPAASIAAYFTAPYWCNFTNIIGDAVEPQPQSLTLNQDAISLRPGTTQRLIATVSPTDANGTIVWNSTNDNVASVADGLVTAIAPGECDIIASCFGAQAICHVNVIEVKPTSITLSQDNALMETGSQLSLFATILPDSTTYKTVEWSSLDENVATVDNGVVTAVHSGECDIIARCQNVQTICHVIVTDILPTVITLSQESALMELDSELILYATVLPESATYKTVTWLSSDESIATVNNGVVTAVGPGECNIIASCGDRQAICHVIVVEHLFYITLDQHSASLLPNHIITLTPTVAPVATDLVVTSSNPAVAAARLAGDKIQVVGITEGHATIYVNSADGYAFSDSCLVEVYTERGDVNCDGFVNISDVTALIDVLLGGDVNHSEENADCNNDGKMTISDVTALIDALLGGAPLPEKNYEVITVNGVTFKMIKVQGGTFTMGATPDHGTEDPWNDEWPTHEVTVSSFSIGQTEVTQELWQAVMGSNPSYFTGDANRPVETVSWDACQQFIATLNQLTGMNFRLPTEAEWEYAARGGNMTGGYKYAGSNDINEIAWWDDNACDGVGENSPDYGTHPVALKKANELGLYDMSGNVWEWCQDWYGPYSEEAQINPTGPETGTEHLHRGGSWINYARNCRVSCRFHWVTDGANYVGLRLVK